MINIFSKPFEGKIFKNGNQFKKFMKKFYPCKNTVCSNMYVAIYIKYMGQPYCKQAWFAPKILVIYFLHIKCVIRDTDVLNTQD